MPYPPIQPYETGMLKVSDLHTLYWEVSGKKDGKPILFLHGAQDLQVFMKVAINADILLFCYDTGGPGGGTKERDRQHFDPEAYKI
ncbi:hypothetical protein FRC00_012769, partial [Tulasnella sp. 408]